MPFQSEKQRRYLWANEPEIARDWTDTYGSRVKKQLGGTLNIGYHGSPFYQDIMGQGFKGGAGQSSRFLGMKMPTWAGSGKTFVGSNPNVALRYGVPIEVAKSARNFTLPFGGGFDKSGISFGKETALDPKQATKGMRLMEKLRSGVYSGSPTAQRLLSTGTTAATSGGIGITRALMSSPMMATTLGPTLLAQHLYGPLASEADKVMGLAGETADEELLDEAFQYLGKTPFTPGDSFRSMNDASVYETIEDDLDKYSESELMESDTTTKEGILSKFNPLKIMGFLADLYTGGSSRALTKQGSLGILNNIFKRSGEPRPDYQYRTPGYTGQLIASDLYDPKTRTNRS